MKTYSYLLCLCLLIAMCLSSCDTNSVEFDDGCEEGEKTCSDDFLYVYICAVDKADHHYWDYALECPYGCEKGLCKAYPNACFSEAQTREGQLIISRALDQRPLNDDGTCKCHSRCPEDCAEDGQCYCSEQCIFGCETDGSCKKKIGCLHGWDEYGLCKCDPDCKSVCDTNGKCTESLYTLELVPSPVVIRGNGSQDATIIFRKNKENLDPSNLDISLSSKECVIANVPQNSNVITLRAISKDSCYAMIHIVDKAREVPEIVVPVIHFAL